jgi:hypothetical protein
MSIVGGLGIEAANEVRRQQGRRDLGKSVTVASVVKEKNSKDAKGPQKKLEENQYKTDDLRYPLDLGTNSFERLHYMTFYVNVQEKSGYNVNERTNFSGQANANRFADKAAGTGQLSGSREGLGVLGEVVGGAIFGAAGASALSGLGIKGAVVGGVVGGLVGSTIIDSIDLTRKTRRIKSTISLYMPDTVNQQIIHEFGEISMTEALGLVGAISQGAAAIGTSVGDFVDRMQKGESAGAAFKGAGAPGGAALAELGGTIAEASGAFGGGIKEAILFSAGVALNPQIEVLYQKTGHREFLFDFKMIARNEAEGAAIREIIKQFKFYSAPELLAGTSGRYFIPPAEFDIKFFYNGQENINIHKISTCALVGIDVDYAGAGQWTTFTDGMPVEIKMQLRFKELELMHKGRIEEGY